MQTCIWEGYKIEFEIAGNIIYIESVKSIMTLNGDYLKTIPRNVKNEISKMQFLDLKNYIRKNFSKVRYM